MKSITILDNSITKVASVDDVDCDPDRELLLEEPPLKSNKSMSTAADSSDLQAEQQQHKHHHNKGFRGGNMRYNEGRTGGKVIIDAKPAGAAAPVAPAQML